MLRILKRTRGILLVLAAACLAAAQVTVSPEGPIKTLADARDAARAERRAGKQGPITITVKAGTYYLRETLVLGPEDSDTIWEAAAGDRPVISGGRLIAGWVKKKGDLWTAKSPIPYFRQLFVDGRRALRTRTPKYGFYRADGPSSLEKPMRWHYRGSDIKPGWAGRDVELVGFLAWSDLRMPIASIDEASRMVTLTADPMSAREDNARYFIENTPDALDQGGEWYLDRQTWTVSYLSLVDDMKESQVVAPALERLVLLQGKPEAGQFVRNVVFRKLTFAHADWSMGPKGFFDRQAAVPAPSAIETVGAINFRFEKCTVEHAGGYGLYLGRGSQHNQVLASHFHDLGAGGVKVGEAEQGSSEAEQNDDNVIADNHIHDVGLVYAPAVGIWILQSSKNQIIHNHVHDLFYTAISLGWTWGYGKNQSKENLIAFNHLHSIGKDVLSDMAGIYTLGMQPGTIIRNNLIHDVSSFTYGGWGIYPDEGSSEMLIENNIVHSCKSAGFHQHYGRNNLVRNNIFAFNHEYELMLTRPEPHRSFSVERNIVYYDQGDLLGSEWDKAIGEFRNNIYFDRRGPNILFAGQTFADWKRSGKDVDSVIADPLFVNADNFDFRLRPESPALKMGFQQIDMSTVGPREPAGADAW